MNSMNLRFMRSTTSISNSSSLSSVLPSLVEDVPGATQHALAERLRLLSFEDLSVRDLSMEEAQEWQFGFYVPPPPPPARLGAGRRAAARLFRRRPAHRRA